MRSKLTRWGGSLSAGLVVLIIVSSPIAFGDSGRISARSRTVLPAVSSPSLPMATLMYSTYLGGDITDQIWDMATDALGNTYITGYTTSSNLPVVNAFQPAYGGQGDGFVAKFDPNGVPIYITYLGGNYLDSSQDIAVDSAGNAYVSGWTGSTNFPTVNAFQPTYAGTWDAFVCKISADGSTLLYSSYLGGSGEENGINAGTPGGIAVDSNGYAYVTGTTGSADFPVVNAFQPSLDGTTDTFITKISPSGSSLTYSTYLGGERTEAGFDIAVDASGNAYVAGDTQSFAYPVVNAAQPVCAPSFTGGCYDAAISVLNPAGSALVYSTYLGGNDIEWIDRIFSVFVDNTGSAYVTGMTGSNNFPFMNAYQPSYGGQIDAFITKYSSTGTMQYSTFLGGTNSEVGYGIVVDIQGQISVAGLTLSTDFPLEGPMQTVLGGFEDPFITQFKVGGQSLAFSTYFGGANDREEYGAVGIGLDAANTIHVAGSTMATDFPIQNAYQQTNHGFYDGFISRIAITAPCAFSISPPSQSFDASGGSGSIAVTTAVECFWTSTSNDAWITITAGGSGNGNGTIQYSVDPNPTATPRTGTISIADQTFTVTQAGVACSYSIAPDAETFGSPGGTGNVNVTAPDGCNWTASPNDPWITITSGSSGSGNGVVSYSVSANPDPTPRTGTMLIAAQTFTVSQSAGCLFCDEFEDGSIDPNWTYINSISDWSESNGALIGSSQKKTETHAIPAFNGCTTCYAETILRSSGSASGRVWFLFHVQDKNNLVELMMDDKHDRWVLKRRINKAVVAKQKFSAAIDANTDYLLRIRYDGTNFIASINGVDVMTLAPGGPVTGGSVGFRVKSTTATSQRIEVN